MRVSAESFSAWSISSWARPSRSCWSSTTSWGRAVSRRELLGGPGPSAPRPELGHEILDALRESAEGLEQMGRHAGQLADLAHPTESVDQRGLRRDRRDAVRDRAPRGPDGVADSIGHPAQEGQSEE
jgi:hypothetical protein